MTRQATAAIQMQALGTITNVLSANTDDVASARAGEVISALQLVTGVEDDQLNRIIAKRDISLSSGGILTLDLFDFAGFDAGGGDGNDTLGLPMALDSVVFILVTLKAGSAGKLRIGGEGSSSAFNSIFDGRDDAKAIIQSTATNPGIFFIMNPNADGYTVTDGANHLLNFEAVSGSVTFSVTIGARENP